MSEPEVSTLTITERRESTLTRSFREVYTAEALDIIRQNKCAGATDAEFAALMTIAAMKNLNPMTGQIHFVSRSSYDAATKTKTAKWVPQVGIDGFRLQAARTGEYDGQDEPMFMYDDKGQLLVAKVSAFRKGITRAFVGVARFDEYVQTFYKDGHHQPNSMWASKPHIMLAKCAEALALRKAFPEELGDLLLPEEIETDSGTHVTEQIARGVVQLTANDGDVKQRTQAALPEPKKDRDWAARLAAATTRDELTDVGKLMTDELPKGTSLRKAMSAVYVARLKEFDKPKENPVAKDEPAQDTAAEPEKKPDLKKACEECGLLGTHAPLCPDNDDASREPA